MGAQSGERTHHLSHRPCWPRPDGLAQARELLRHGSRLSRPKQDLEILPPHCHCPPSCGLFYCRNRRHVCAIPERFSSARALCGAFQLQLLLLDRLGPHHTEPWRATWTGVAAQRFWQTHNAALLPGTALVVELDRARIHTLACCPPRSEVQAHVIHSVHWCRRAAGSLQALQRGMSSRSMRCDPRNRLSKPEPCH